MQRSTSGWRRWTIVSLLAVALIAGACAPSESEVHVSGPATEEETLLRPISAPVARPGAIDFSNCADGDLQAGVSPRYVLHEGGEVEVIATFVNRTDHPCPEPTDVALMIVDADGNKVMTLLDHIDCFDKKSCPYVAARGAYEVRMTWDGQIRSADPDVETRRAEPGTYSIGIILEGEQDGGDIHTDGEGHHAPLVRHEAQLTVNYKGAFQEVD